MTLWRFHLYYCIFLMLSEKFSYWSKIYLKLIRKLTLHRRLLVYLISANRSTSVRNILWTNLQPRYYFIFYGDYYFFIQESRKLHYYKLTPILKQFIWLYCFVFLKISKLCPWYDSLSILLHYFLHHHHSFTFLLLEKELTQS